MHDCRMGWAPLAALIAAQHEQRRENITASTPRLSEEEQAERRKLDVPPPAGEPLLSDDKLIEWADELVSGDDDARAYLVSHLRDGCTCFISPPCNACCDPVHLNEAQMLADWHAERSEA